METRKQLLREKVDAVKRRLENLCESVDRISNNLDGTMNQGNRLDGLLKGVESGAFEKILDKLIALQNWKKSIESKDDSGEFDAIIRSQLFDKLKTELTTDFHKALTPFYDYCQNTLIKTFGLAESEIEELIDALKIVILQGLYLGRGFSSAVIGNFIMVPERAINLLKSVIVQKAIKEVFIEEDKKEVTQ